MRALLPLLLACTACGSVPPVLDGSGGAESSGGSGQVGSGGSSGGAEAGSGGASGGTEAGSGGAPEQTGGASGGSSSGGQVGTGGSTGGTDGTGGSEPQCEGPPPTCVVDPDACEPPVLGQGSASGDDLNDTCGWTSELAPEGYAGSYELVCEDDSHLLTRRMAWPDEGVRFDTYVSVIDPADRCAGASNGLDRSFSIEGPQFCIRISSPFEGETWVDPNGPNPKGFSSGGGLNVSGFCSVLGFEGAEEQVVPEDALLVVDVGIDVPGWVRVDAAELVDWECPLSCGD